jgi:hypothetical protein
MLLAYFNEMHGLLLFLENISSHIYSLQGDWANILHLHTHRK